MGDHQPYDRTLTDVKTATTFATSEQNTDWLDNLGADYVDFLVDVTDAGSNTTLTIYADADDGSGSTAAQMLEEDGSVGGSLTRWSRTFAAAVKRLPIRVGTRGLRTRLVVKGDNASGSYTVAARRVWR